ncbi:MAG: hypothetical protein QM564_08330 [Bergeyella sp.]
MKKIFLIILMLFFCTVKSQKNYTKERKQAIKVLKSLNYSYLKKDKNLNEFFTESVQCSICEIENGYDNEYLIKNQIFIKNNLKEVIGFLNYKMIKKSKSQFSKQENDFVLSYETVKSNEKTQFEGASALIIFKKEDGNLKIYGIQTIP